MYISLHYFLENQTLRNLVSLSHDHHPSARVGTNENELVGGRMKTRAAHDRCQRFSRHLAKELAISVENFHAARFVHAARAKNVELRMPPCLKGGQPSACLIVVPNPVGWLEGFATLDKVGVLGDVQAIGKGRGQQALSARRKEGTAHGQTRGLRATRFGQFRGIS